MIENKLQPSPFFYIIKITIVFLQFRENNLNHFFGRHKDQNIARCTHSSHVLSFSWFLAKWLKRSKVSILISLVFGNFSGNLGNCSYLFYYLHSFFCAKYWPAFHLILSLVLSNKMVLDRTLVNLWLVKKATKSTKKIQIAQPACKPVQISNSGS